MVELTQTIFYLLIFFSYFLLIESFQHNRILIHWLPSFQEQPMNASEIWISFAFFLNNDDTCFDYANRFEKQNLTGNPCISCYFHWFFTIYVCVHSVYSRLFSPLLLLLTRFLSDSNSLRFSSSSPWHVTYILTHTHTHIYTELYVHVYVYMRDSSLFWWWCKNKEQWILLTISMFSFLWTAERATLEKRLRSGWDEPFDRAILV